MNFRPLPLPSLRQFLPILALVAFTSCGSPSGPTRSPSPSPTPTPLPSPSPSPVGIVEPLRTVGTGFVPPILGSIICCSDGVDQHGWPLVDEATIDQLQVFGANWTHIRLGPYAPHDGADAFARVGEDKADVTKWNDAYWLRVRGIVSYAAAHGVYVEVDILDGWALKPANREWASAWFKGNNINNVELDCEMFTNRPAPVIERWVEKAVKELGEYPNVVWQIGNETGACPWGTSRAWEEGMAQLVRGTGNTLLVGTNGDHPSYCPSCDYDSWHQEMPCTPQGRPCQVNEFSDITVAEWAERARTGHALGTPFHLWRSGNWHEADNLAALEALKQITKESK